MVYIVSYDLIEPGQRYDDLINLIKQEKVWAKLGGSAYLIESSMTAVELRDRYKEVLDGNDKLYVGAVTTPAAWYGLSDQVSEWIKNNLR
jgi:hypothetical protein